MIPKRFGLRMRGCASVIGVLAALTLGFSETGEASPVFAVCAPADDYTALRLSQIQRLVTSADTGDVAERNRLQWPSVAATSVTYVTDNAVCSAAEAAYTPTVPASVRVAPSGTVYVFKIGTVYFVSDHAQRAGEWVIAMTLDRRFKVLAKTKI